MAIRDHLYANTRKENDCMIWQRATDYEGYGVLYNGAGKNVKAHRFSFEQHHQVSILAGWIVMHTCDMPACINPEHLILGTRALNSMDMLLKGRAGKGGLPKLELKDYDRIITRLDVSSEQLAEELGVTRQAIYSVRSKANVRYNRPRAKPKGPDRRRKLTLAQVAEIQTSPLPAKWLAGHYGVGLQHIYSLRKRFKGRV